jgi:membrane protease subunit HflK
LSGFYVVDAKEQAVILRFGRFSGTSEPGLRWRLPYPLEHHEIVNLTEVRTIEIGYRGTAENRIPEESLMLTEDQNIIDVQFSVQYNIKNAKDFLFNNVFKDKDANEIVKQGAETAIREVVGKNKIDFVLNEGRTAISSQAQQLIQSILDRYKIGVYVVKVNINDVQPPVHVQAAFNDAVKAGQDKERLINEGIAYANDIVPRAKGMASRLLEEAEGYQQKVIGVAQGDSARFSHIVSEYSKSPRVIRERMYLDTMQQVLSQSTKVIVDQKSGQNLLYLPLDQLIKKSDPLSPLDPSNKGVVPSLPRSTGKDESSETNVQPSSGELKEGRLFFRGNES